MKTFIAHYLNDSAQAVEFTADTMEEAEAIAEEHGLDTPREVQLVNTAPSGTPVEDVVEVAKAVIDKEHSTVH
jgi:hypothetical protein